MAKIGRFCASCHWYDGFADACGYPRSGCEKAEKEKPPVRTDAADNDKACRGCKYLDKHSQACNFPGFGCAEWKDDRKED